MNKWEKSHSGDDGCRMGRYYGVKRCREGGRVRASFQVQSSGKHADEIEHVSIGNLLVG